MSYHCLNLNIIIAKKKQSHTKIYKIYYMKYPDINIQIKYPNKLINADTP